jgi:hypothetical protein
VLVAALAVVILVSTACASYGMGRLATQTELAALNQRLDMLGKGNLRANVFAERAIEAAARAEEKASDARDLAESAIPPHIAIPSEK